MGDLVSARMFIPKPLRMEFFSPSCNGERFLFAALYAIRYIIFHFRSLFSPGFFSSKIFPPSKLVPIPRLKSQMVGPLRICCHAWSRCAFLTFWFLISIQHCSLCSVAGFPLTYNGIVLFTNVKQIYCGNGLENYLLYLKTRIILLK